MDSAPALRRFADAVRRQRDILLTDPQVMRAVADLIKRAFELGAFQAGPLARVGDRIRPWLVGPSEETVPLADGFRTPLWVPIVFYAVLDGVGPCKLFADRQEWIRKCAPRPNMNVRVTREELAAIADAIDKEANRIDTEAGKRKRKPRVPKDEANVRARAALKGPLPKGAKRWTQRTLAKAIGCSPGLVPELGAWQAYAEQHGLKRSKEGCAPKGVSLTNELLAVKGQEDTELERLIAEHQAHFEESPLVSNVRKHRRRPKV